MILKQAFVGISFCLDVNQKKWKPSMKGVNSMERAKNLDALSKFMLLQIKTWKNRSYFTAK